LFGHFGIEWDIASASAEEQAGLAEAIVFYKRMRPLLHGGQGVRAGHPNPAAYLHGVVAGDRAEALFAYVQLTASAFETPGLARFPGLEPGRRDRGEPLEGGGGPGTKQGGGPGGGGGGVDRSGAGGDGPAPAGAPARAGPAGAPHELVSGPVQEDPRPGAGGRAPRAWGASDAPSLDLSGAGRFRLSPRADADEAFADPGFDDRGWDSLPVPSHWQLHGHGAPAYTNGAYPVPVDPPHG